MNAPPDNSAAPLDVAAAKMRRPIGVYAHVNINKVIADPRYDTQLDLCNLFTSLLANDAVQGLMIGLRWDDLEPDEGTYAWQKAPGCPAVVFSGINKNTPSTPASALVGAFDLAEFYGKSIHLSVSPGFHTPPWLITKLKSCDGWFDNQKNVDPNCGTVFFTGYPEQTPGDGTELPLPWNTTYQNKWTTFIGKLAGAFGPQSQYSTTLDSISVAGPTGASPEMILPTDINTTPMPQPSPTYVNPNVVWSTVMQHQVASEVGSDQVFVDAWATAITTYNDAFKGVTLVLTPDNGLQFPDFGATAPSPNPLFAQECVYQPNMSCEATSRVLYNATTLPSPANLFAAETGGMVASSAVLDTTGDVGLPGIKALTDKSAAHPIYGGAQFDHAVTDSTTLGYTCAPTPSPYTFIQIEGCLTTATTKHPCPCGDSLTPEQAIYNVMSAFFAGTPAACQFPYQGTGPITSSPLSYLTVEYEDVVYAMSTSACSPVGASQTPVSAQYLFSLANWSLMKKNMGNAPYPSPSPLSNCSTLPACP